MKECVIRCSSLSRIMTEPKTQKEGTLSVGAKTHIRELAREAIFGVHKEVSSKEMEKGVMVEHQSIALYNSVFSTALEKNTLRRTVDHLTGEPDLIGDSLIVDVKSSWSIHTFPISEADAKDTDYEWQGRGYMKLFDKPRFQVAYCLVDTPAELLRFEQQAAHYVSHIPEFLRVTTWEITRDIEKEALIDLKVAAARQYFAQVIEEFDRAHYGAWETA